MRALVADNKGRASFAAFAAVAIIAIAGMSLFVFRAVAMGSQAYEVEQGTVFYDTDGAFVQTAAPGTARTSWAGDWTVSCEDGSSYELGEHGVLYAEGSDEVVVLGDVWRVAEDGGVASSTGCTVLDADTGGLYKLADRQYVLAARQITCEDAGIDTAPYVSVRMDRAGNAWIANHDMNVRTVQPLVLNAGALHFDIANERLQTLGDDGSVVTDVDLSKIGGSTNEYSPLDEAPDDASDGASGSTSGVVGGSGGSASASGGAGGSSSSSSIAGSTSGSTSGSTGSGSQGSGKNPNAGIAPQLTLTGTSTGVTSVTFDYRVYDPNGTFATVYALISKVSGGEPGQPEKVLLNAGSTTKTIYGLSPNSVYRITLGYTLYKQDGDGATEKTADFINVTTKAMGVGVTVPSLSSKSITARVTTSASYPLDSAELVLYSRGMEVARQAVDTSKASATGGWSTTFANPGDGSFELRLENAVYRGEAVELSASCTVKNNITHVTTS